MITGDLPEGQNPLLYQKMLAAIITGAIGITVANPTDVVKVRLQNQRNFSKKSANHHSMHYTGTMDCYSKIVRNEGIKGLWTSWSANCFRNSVINCAELASYDQYK
jgi:solute carrier family 25 uncoupling protein 8/9